MAFIPTSNNSWGQILGSTIGQGLATEHYSTSDVLKQLANDKAQQVRANHLKKFMPSATPEQLQALSTFPEKWQQGALQGGFGAAPVQSAPEQLQGQVPPQMMANIQQNKQPNGLQALQQAMNVQPREKIPSYAEQEFLRRMQKQYGNQMPQQQQLEPQQQMPTPPAQNMVQPTAPQQVQQAAGQPPVSLGQALQRGLGKSNAQGGTPGTQSGITAEENKNNAANKPYLQSLEKRATASREVLDKASQMLDMLKDPNRQVNSSALLPNYFQNEDSQQFEGLGDDVAAAMTALQSGVQNISKIKWNKSRKPNITQKRGTQIERVNDLINDAAKVALEDNITNYLITQDNYRQPKQLRAQVGNIYNKLERKIPLKADSDEEGNVLVDPKTGVRWLLQGPIYTFDGFVGGQ